MAARSVQLERLAQRICTKRVAYYCLYPGKARTLFLVLAAAVVLVLTFVIGGYAVVKAAFPAIRQPGSLLVAMPVDYSDVPAFLVAARSLVETAGGNSTRVRIAALGSRLALDEVRGSCSCFLQEADCRRMLSVLDDSTLANKHQSMQDAAAAAPRWQDERRLAADMRTLATLAFCSHGDVEEEGILILPDPHIISLENPLGLLRYFANEDVDAFLGDPVGPEGTGASPESAGGSPRGDATDADAGSLARAVSVGVPVVLHVDRVQRRAKEMDRAHLFACPLLPGQTPSLKATARLDQAAAAGDGSAESYASERPLGKDLSSLLQMQKLPDTVFYPVRSSTPIQMEDEGAESEEQSAPIPVILRLLGKTKPWQVPLD